MKTVKIAIADDHPIICKGIATLIRNSTPYDVCFTAHSKEELMSSMEIHVPHILILDVILPGVIAAELFSEIISHYPSLSVIAYTSLNSPILIKMLFREGVRAYVNKGDDPDDLLKAIETILEKKTYINEQYSHLLEKKPDEQEIAVSRRELDVLALIAEQLTTSEIAERLFISPNTVESHRKKLLEKFRVENIAGLIREAMRRGYLQ